MFIGIDLGTTELKVVLLSPEDQVLASHRVALAISRPRPLWSEQDPAHWWSALETAMAGLVASSAAYLPAVRGIGLSGQMHGAVLLDAPGKVLRPAILWNDGRSASQCEALGGAVSELASITGNQAMPGFTAPKLMWVRDQEPAVFARIAHVLLPKDFLRFCLCGDLITDCSDASGTLWLDVAARRWSDRILAACGLSPRQMPALVEGTTAAGTLRSSLAARWKVPHGVVIAGGGGDNAASGVGIGAVHDGEGFVSLGTSGVIFAVTEGFRPHPETGMHAFCHAVPGRWHQMSVMLSAASCLQWAARLTGVADEASLIARCAHLSPAQRVRAPLFLPYLSGERTPLNDPLAQGVLFGLTHDHDGAAIAWSVLEGVCFGLAEGYRTLDISRRADKKPLALVGGGSRSDVWAELLASALDVPLGVSPGHEAAAATGAARLARLASGGSFDEVLAPHDRHPRMFEPNRELQRILEPRYARFGALYSTLRSSFPGR